MNEVLAALKTIGVVLGAWTLVSIAAALFLIPWFRARARANAALSKGDRSADWASAVRPEDGRKIAPR